MRPRRSSSAAPGAAACPSACAAAARRRARSAWAPCTGASAPAQWARSCLGVEPLAGRARRRSRSPPRPTAGSARPSTAASSTPRVGLEHGLDLRRRDVLAAADDRVGLAPADAQAPALVELAEVAGVQPAVGRERTRRDGRAGARRISPSAAIRTPGAEQRRPGACAARPARCAATGVVVTCEQLSVRP